MNSKRNVYLDFMRIIAIFFVVFNHTGNYGYMLFSLCSDKMLTWIYMFVTMITRINVPLFFMISGTLLLDKNESIKSLYKKRVFKYVIVVLIFSLAIYINTCLLNTFDFNIVSFIESVYSGNIDGSYWYLYTYLGALIMLPVLRKAVGSMENKDYIYILIIHFILSSVLPIIQYSLKPQISLILSGDLAVPVMTTKSIFYMLMGYWIDQKVDTNSFSKKKILALLGFGFIGIIISSAFTYHQGITDIYSQAFVQLFDYVITIVVFIIVKYIFNNISINDNINKIINTCGGVTIGIYLLDPIFRSRSFVKIYNTLYPQIPSIIVCFIYCLCSMAVCGFATFLFKKFTILKKIL